MKQCPECKRTYTDETLNFCLDDGAGLGRAQGEEPTLHYRSTGAPAISQGITDPLNGKSIAVLPFSNLSADPENEFFCDGLAEELIGSLVRIEGLKVASRTSAFSFKAKSANITDIAAALGVTFVLEGSVRRAGNRLRISVNLVNAEHDRPVWSERFDREMQDIFDVQDEIALSVVDALKVKLLGDERAAVLKRYTNNPEAYQLFLKGRFHWYKHTPEDISKSREYFQRSIEVDPYYAPGRAGLAEFYGVSAALGLMDPSVGWPLAESELRRAQELDDALPEVHNGLAAVQGIYYRNVEGAERELRRAMELNPRFAEAHSLYSFILSGQGRFEEAIREAATTLDLDPLSLVYHRYLGWWFYYSRRFDDAIAKYRQVIEIDPSFPQVHLDLRDALQQSGRIDEAVEAWKQSALLAGDSELLVALDAGNNPDAAITEAATVGLNRLDRRRAMGEWVPPVKFARCFLRLGDKENALAWFLKASDVRDCFSLWLRVDPFYDQVVGDRRFDEIVSSIH